MLVLRLMTVDTKPERQDSAEMQPEERAEAAYHLIDQIESAILSYPETHEALARQFFERDSFGLGHIADIKIKGVDYRVFFEDTVDGETFDDIKKLTISRDYKFYKGKEAPTAVLDLFSRYKRLTYGIDEDPNKIGILTGKIEFIDGVISLPYERERQGYVDRNFVDREAIVIVPLRFPELFPRQDTVQPTS